MILTSIVVIQVHCGGSTRLQSSDWFPVTAIHTCWAAMCVFLPALRGDSTAPIFLIYCHQKSCHLAADILGLLGLYCFLCSPPYFCRVEESPLIHIQQAFLFFFCISENHLGARSFGEEPPSRSQLSQLLTNFLHFQICQYILQNTGFC